MPRSKPVGQDRMMTTIPDRIVPDPPSGSVEVLAFLVGAEEFCLPVLQVREIRAWTEPTPLPHSDPAIAGVINLRGTVLLIIDLSRALALTATRGDTHPVIVVVEARGRLAGLLVDRVQDIIALPAASLEPAPAIPSPSGAAGLAALALHDGRLLRILDPLSLLPDGSGDGA